MLFVAAPAVSPEIPSYFRPFASLAGPQQAGVLPDHQLSGFSSRANYNLEAGLSFSREI